MDIAVDIDDTLTNSFDYFMPFIAEYLGVELSELKRRNISYSNLPEEWRGSEVDFCRKYYDRIVSDTTFKPDAAWGMRELHRLGHRIIIITGRTEQLYTDPYKTTREELARGGIEYDGLICTTKKAEACMSENISIMIDDLPKNCKAVAACGVTPLLFTSPANRDSDVPYRRVGSWAEAVEAVKQITCEPNA
mgnify:CR=1 FL=1